MRAKIAGFIIYLGLSFAVSLIVQVIGVKILGFSAIAAFTLGFGLSLPFTFSAMNRLWPESRMESEKPKRDALLLGDDGEIIRDKMKREP